MPKAGAEPNGADPNGSEGGTGAREGAAWNIWTPANGVSLLRLALAWPAWYLITSGRYLAALAVVLAATLSDGLDGYLARSRGEISKFGQLIDPIADKVIGTVVFAALVLQGELPSWAFWALVVKEAALVLGGMLLVSRRVIAARRLGKVATVVLFIGFALILAGLGALGRFGALAGVALSLAAGVDYALQAARPARSQV